MSNVYITFIIRFQGKVCNGHDCDGNSGRCTCASPRTGASCGEYKVETCNVESSCKDLDKNSNCTRKAGLQRSSIRQQVCSNRICYSENPVLRIYGQYILYKILHFKWRNST